jgi:hypothetical protein
MKTTYAFIYHGHGVTIDEDAAPSHAMRPVRYFVDINNRLSWKAYNTSLDEQIGEAIEAIDKYIVCA